MHSVWITEKVSFNIAIEVSYVYILSDQKCQKWSILARFWKPEACGQTVLPDRSVLIGQKLVENAEIEKSKCDILSNFQTMWKWVLIQRSIEHVQGFYCTNNCNSHYFLCIVSPTICDFEKFDKIHHYLSSSPLNPQNEFENPWHPLIVHRFCLLKLSVEPIYEFLYLIDHRSSNVDCKIPWQVKLLRFSILAEKYFWHFLHGYMSEIRPFQLPQGKVDQSWKSPKIIFEFFVHKMAQLQNNTIQCCIICRCTLTYSSVLASSVK